MKVLRTIARLLPETQPGAVPSDAFDQSLGSFDQLASESAGQPDSLNVRGAPWRLESKWDIRGGDRVPHPHPPFSST